MSQQPDKDPVVELRARFIAEVKTFIPIQPQEGWEEDGLCAQVGCLEWFYPTKNHQPAEAILVCAGCPVRIDCLSDALLRRDPHGVWGGVNGPQREQQHARLTKAGVPNLSPHQADEEVFGCGHPKSGENRAVRSNGKTYCRQCDRERYRVRKVAAAA